MPAAAVIPAPIAYIKVVAVKNVRSQILVFRLGVLAFIGQDRFSRDFFFGYAMCGFGCI